MLADAIRTSIGSAFSWPRGKPLSYGFLPWGLSFAGLKRGRPLVSSTFAVRNVPSEYFDQFVPGTVGDLLARPDTVFGGAGWKYVNDENYVTYFSSDYDQRGIDLSGNNYPDWPIRIVEGRQVFVREVKQRVNYEPYYASDEDLFCVFKDTDTRADPEYAGPTANPDSFSIPIGIEVRQFCYTWRALPLNDALLLVFQVTNGSGVILDSCYAGLGLRVQFQTGGAQTTLDTNRIGYYGASPKRNLVIQYNPTPATSSSGTSFLPHLGVACISSPNGAAGTQIGLSVSRAGIETWTQPLHSDAQRYRRIAQEPEIDSAYQWLSGFGRVVQPPHYFATGPFRMQPGDSVTVAFGIMFAEGLDRLLKLDDLVERVYDTGFKVPSPPIQPQLSAQGVDKGVSLHWDDAAEKSVDPIIPDSLGKPFIGYRLYRSRGSGEPFVMIREWEMGRDSIVHDYLDRGQDGKDPTIAPGGGLTNNIEYLYRLTAYDGGAPSLGVPELESAGKILAAVPQAEPSSPYSLDEVRVVPNPYVVEHAGQKTLEQARLFFNYLPVECTIRIYTVALDLVAELHHQGGSTEQWDMKTQAGQQVASQMFLARIETPQGTSVTKKFSVVVAE